MQRWPPAYDAEELADSISKLVASADQSSGFYETHGQFANPDFCQGDILAFNSELPLIHSDGEPGLYEKFEYWLLIGNTCDIARTIEDVKHTQIVPLFNLGSSDQINPQALDALKKYQCSRQFYIPPWDSNMNDLYCADFTMPVTIHKQALFDLTQVVGSFTQIAWFLLNACLVRFLARDDGRYS